MNDIDICSQHLHTVFFQDAGFRHPDCRIQRSLPAQGRQQGIRPLTLNDLNHAFRGDGFDIGPISQLWISHDRCRIRVDQYHLVPFLLKRLDGLGTRVVKLTGLADDDRPGADDKDFFDICAFWHDYEGIRSKVYGVR